MTTFPSLVTPVVGNLEFPPGILAPIFADWRDGNPSRLGDLYEDGALLDRESCIDAFELTYSDGFRLNQLLHWANTSQVLVIGGRARTDWHYPVILCSDYAFPSIKA